MMNRNKNAVMLWMPILGGRALLFAGVALGLCQCSSQSSVAGAGAVVSVKDQKLAVYDGNGSIARTYPVSTSKFGLSDKPGTYGTPLGMLEVVAKIGHGAPAGAVFKNRSRTGEVIKPGTPGRDPIVSRILWLRGLEPQNRNAYNRAIYIHGTADEADVGRAASYGCIRMKSRDVIELFSNMSIGSRVYITEAKLPPSVQQGGAPRMAPLPADRPPLLLNPQSNQPPQVTLAQNSSAPPARTSTQPLVLPDGSSVIYSAPVTSSSPGLVLRSKRKSAKRENN